MFIFWDGRIVFMETSNIKVEGITTVYRIYSIINDITYFYLQSYNVP